MEGLRLVAGEDLSPLAPCCRCAAAGCPWDRVAGKSICPDCQEALEITTVETAQGLIANKQLAAVTVGLELARPAAPL